MCGGRKSLVVACHQLTANRMDIEHGLAADTMKENWLKLLEKVRKMSPSSPHTLQLLGVNKCLAL